MLHQRFVRGRHDCIRLHFKCVFLPVGMDNDLIAKFQLVQIDERTRQTIREIYMTGQHAVAIPGRESASFEPSSLILQPGHIPGAIPLRHTNDGDVHCL